MIDYINKIPQNNLGNLSVYDLRNLLKLENLINFKPTKLSNVNKYLNKIWVKFNDNETTEVFYNKFHFGFNNLKIVDSLYSYKRKVNYLTVIDKYAGKFYSATGYGGKIPTDYKVFINNRLYRVYCAQFSNAGSLYVTVMGNRINLI